MVIGPAAEQSEMYASGSREYVVRLVTQVPEGSGEETVGRTKAIT